MRISADGLDLTAQAQSGGEANALFLDDLAQTTGPSRIDGGRISIQGGTGHGIIGNTQGATVGGVVFDTPSTREVNDLSGRMTCSGTIRRDATPFTC